MAPVRIRMRRNAPLSPRIVSSGWGRVEVQGQPVPLRDVMLYPGGAKSWDWRATGTSHHSGIHPADLETLLEHGAREIILSTGRLGLLRVQPAVLDLLARRGVRVHVMRSGAAIARYNELAGESTESGVGALIHSTC